MRLNPFDIYNLLPKKNCKKCGLPSCMAFAIKLIKREVGLEDCPEINSAIYIRNKMKLKDILREYYKSLETKLVINEKLCNGCGICMISCPVNASSNLNVAGGKGFEKDDENLIYKVENGIVKVINIKKCRRFEEDIESRPCSVCVDNCPTKAIYFL